MDLIAGAGAPFVYTAAAVLGLVVGSFLNVVILRLPNLLRAQWQSQCAELAGTVPAPENVPGLVRPGSRCPHCRHALRARDNVPVLSFLWLRGRCAHCGERISWRYPLVEVLTAVATVCVLWRLGPTPAGAVGLLFTWALIALAVIDFDTQYLPDNITLPLLWLGLAANLYPLYTTLPSAVIGALAGYLSLWLIYQAHRRVTGKEGMGHGDFKLLGALGAWLGWQMLPLVILLSALSAALLGLAAMGLKGHGRDVPIPFGPFLAIAGWIALLWGPELVSTYLRASGLQA